MSNDFYTVTGSPSTAGALSSAVMRSELVAIQTGFDKLPPLLGNGLNFATINSAGTGMTSLTTAQALSQLGLTIGTNVQAYDADLAAIAALTSAADKLPYSTGAQAWALTSFTAAGRSIVGAANFATAGVVPWGVAGGSADVITVTCVPANAALVDGLIVGFRASAANATTTPTLAVDGLTARTITKIGGTALSTGDIAGALAECLVRYNLANTRWELLNPRWPVFSQLTSVLGADVLLNNTSNYFDGPSVAQGTAGTWFVMAQMNMQDTVAGGQIGVKLWDGTNVISEAQVTMVAGATPGITLSGYITSPAGNLRISARDFASINGKILFNLNGNSKSASLFAIRIA